MSVEGLPALSFPTEMIAGDDSGQDLHLPGLCAKGCPEGCHTG